MIQLPFLKLHGAENDFLLTWRDRVPVPLDMAGTARRLCARNTGIGADGWLLAERTSDGIRTRLFNSDGSEAEISGNGTRCAAAFALEQGAAEPPMVRVETAAGPKHLRLVSRRGLQYVFEMDMGLPQVEELRATLRLAGVDFDATVLNVGNPQCAIFVEEFPVDWLAAAREAEAHARFPKRSNISFVRPLDRHTLEVRFFERGAGETRSSGTGSTGAAVAAILREVAESPLEIVTPAGRLRLRWDDAVFLTGPAEIIGEGSFFLD